MTSLILAYNYLCSTEMEYHGKFEHNIGQIQHISIIIIIDIFYTACLRGTQNVAPTLPSFQGIERYIQYLSSHLNKTIFYPSNYYYG